MAYYVICDDNSKHESMTAEQILATIAQAINTGKIGECDTGFVTMVKEKNGGNCITFWVGTQAQYNAIAEKEQNCLYIITDETTGADLERWVIENYLTKMDAAATYLAKADAAATYLAKADAANTYAPKDKTIVKKYDSGWMDGTSVFDITNRKLGEFEYFHVTCRSIDGTRGATVIVDKTGVAMDILTETRTSYPVMQSADGGELDLYVEAPFLGDGVKFTVESLRITRVVGYGFA